MIPAAAFPQSQHSSLQSYSEEQKKKRKPSAPERPNPSYAPPSMLDPVLEGGDDNPFILPENPNPVPVSGPLGLLLFGGTAYALRRLQTNKE